MKAIRDVILKIVLLSVLWFVVAAVLLWDAVFNDQTIKSHILECWEGIGTFLGVMFLGFVWIGLIGAPAIVIAIVWAYKKDPDAPWRSNGSEEEG